MAQMNSTKKGEPVKKTGPDKDLLDKATKALATNFGTLRTRKILRSPKSPSTVYAARISNRISTGRTPSGTHLMRVSNFLTP